MSERSVFTRTATRTSRSRAPDAGVALRWHRRLHGQRRLRLLGGHVALAPPRLGQPPHHQRPGSSPARRPRGRPTASSSSGRDPAGDAQPDRLPEERRGPLQGEGAPADVGRVVVGDQRLGRRVVDGLTDAERRRARAGTARRSAPSALSAEMTPHERQHDGDDPRATCPVGQVAGGQHHQEAR